MTYSIIIQDHDNKLFQRVTYITGEAEKKITSNITKLQAIRAHLNMHTTAHNVDVNYLLNANWQESESLYDKLILEYNNQSSITSLLTTY